MYVTIQPLIKFGFVGQGHAWGETELQAVLKEVSPQTPFQELLKHIIVI